MNERIPSVIHESWHNHLQPLFNDVKMIKIRDQILPSYKYYPAPPDIFRVFSTPLDKIKVVILGQDPYPNGEAIGLAFAVKESVSLPGSLKIIKQEIIDSKVERDTSVNIESTKWRTLNHWKQQGVFLLNTALTVEMKNPNSHTGYWQWFTREVIKIISYCSPCIWLLWGSKAIAFRDYIVESHPILNTNTNWEGIGKTGINYILNAPHPAAGLYGNGKKFNGCNHFNLCNQILKAKGQTIINW